MDQYSPLLAFHMSQNVLHTAETNVTSPDRQEKNKGCFFLSSPVSPNRAMFACPPDLVSLTWNRAVENWIRVAMILQKKQHTYAARSSSYAHTDLHERVKARVLSREKHFTQKELHACIALSTKPVSH